MEKRFSISTAPVVVPASSVPKEYRIDFTREVPSVAIPYGSPAPVATQVTFVNEGEYTATAGLYSETGTLLGKTAEVTFTVVGTPQTIEVRGVDSVVASDIGVTSLRRNR